MLCRFTNFVDSSVITLFQPCLLHHGFNGLWQYKEVTHDLFCKSSTGTYVALKLEADTLMIVYYELYDAFFQHGSFQTWAEIITNPPFTLKYNDDRNPKSSQYLMITAFSKCLLLRSMFILQFYIFKNAFTLIILNSTTG